MNKKAEFRSSKEKAYSLIKEAIISRKFAPRQFLSENKLARTFGVSRTPIREALQTLEVEGFINLIPRRGAQVTEISLKDLDEIYELRLVLESLAGKKLIQQEDLICLQQMKDLLEVQKKLIEEKDAVKFIEADREFHLALIRAARNERLYKFYDSLRDHILRLGVEAVQTSGRMTKVIEEHKAIVNALESESYEKFTEAIKKHIKMTKFIVGKNLPNIWKE